MSSPDASEENAPFRCETTVEPERVVVSVFSDIDIASVAQFRAALSDAIAAGKPIVVDLSACNYLDSTGISTLVGAHNASVPIGVIASRQAAKLLDIVGLTALLNVTPAQNVARAMTSAEAIGYLASACTAFSFVPQVVRILRTRDVAAISLPMYAAYTVGIALWLAYGIAIGSGPVIASNTVTLVFSASVLFLKIALSRIRADRADTKTHFELP